MRIETSRLRLQLLTLEQADLYFLGNNLLEQNLNLPNANRIIDAHFKEVAETIFLPNLRKDKANHRDGRMLRNQNSNWRVGVEIVFDPDNEK